MSGVSEPPLVVAGAGPAGLSAAITLARAGRRVIVREARPDVGMRFHGDFQGIENWTTSSDALEELRGIGIAPDFDRQPFHEGVFFDPSGRERRVRSPEPAFYLVRRGPMADCLDAALRRQAEASGVEIAFSSRVHAGRPPDVRATGPRAASAIDTGYVFETDMPDGVYGALSDELAPGGYAYLLLWRGRGTLAICMFRGFGRRRRCLERTVSFFERAIGLRMREPRFIGGSGNAYEPGSAVAGESLWAGEAAGFQDALWGFGIRAAMVSGHLAARAILSGRPGEYDRLWRERFGGLLRASFVNRFFYGTLGDRIYGFLLGRLAESGDARAWLHRFYRPSPLHRVLAPVLVRRRRGPRA